MRDALIMQVAGEIQAVVDRHQMTPMEKLLLLTWLTGTYAVAIQQDAEDTAQWVREAHAEAVRQALVVLAVSDA